MYKVNEKRFSISLKSKRKYRKLNISQNNSINLLSIQFSGGYILFVSGMYNRIYDVAACCLYITIYRIFVRPKALELIKEFN